MASGPSKKGKKTAAKRSLKSKNVKKESPPNGISTEEQMLQFYRDMLLIRRFEERAGQLYGMGLIGGFCHLYIGQEAVVVGMQAALQENDSVITSYRDHGHMLACGMESRGVMAELTGRIGGYSKGKGGSMHMFSRDKNFYGGHGIVGAQVSIGTGLAFSHKYKKNNAISVTYFGDGAANQGQVHESFNMAALWKLPVIYVIENNKYGMGTSVERASAETDLYKLGESVDVPGRQVDGMDVEVVKQAGLEAAEWCRTGKGPYILEMQTYRYRGHSMSDPARYRSKEEVDNIRTNSDPIKMLGERLIKLNAATETSLKELDREIRSIVADAAEFAQQSPEPEPKELYSDVYVSA